LVRTLKLWRHAINVSAVDNDINQVPPDRIGQLIAD
jgi:hypothetical protein